jgi:very-short-patch-repair endonuclease
MADARGRGRPLESTLEVRFWQLLRAWKLPLPRPGVEVDDGTSTVFRFDFLYAEHRLAIETDGYRWHRTHEQFASDCERQARAASLGYRVMRFTWADLDASDRVRTRLLVALGLAVLPHRTRWGSELPWPTTSWPARVRLCTRNARSESSSSANRIRAIRSSGVLPAPFKPVAPSM